VNHVEILVRISPRTPPLYSVAVSSPEGSCESTLALPFRLEELAGIVFGVAQTTRDMVPVDLTGIPDAGPAAPSAAQPPKTAKRFGEELFDALFQGKARTVLDRTTAAAKDAGVRIRLSMDLLGDGMTEVASLPWELMRRSDAQFPLIVTNQTLLVRSPDVIQPTEPRPFQPPLRILLVMSNPQGSAPLNLQEERARIDKIWGPLPDVKVDSCAPVVSELLNKLRESDYHVIHYMGHGQYDQATGRGALVMAKEDGAKDLVSGEDLGVYLHDEVGRLRLVFLNACKTATTSARSGVDPFAGIATALIQAGVPAVVAMQFPISDQAAVAFSETFYQSIAKGDPVDVAMAEGRKKLWRLDEWATPVLFLRSKDGVLFESAARPRTDAAQPDADAWGEGAADSPRVFLATPCETLARTQKQVSKKLKEQGVRVIDSTPREDPAAHAALVQRLVRAADLSVHLLGDHPGAPLDADEADTLKTYPLQELAIGIEAAPSQLVLVPDSVNVAGLEDRAYADHIEKLIRMPRTARQFELVITDKNQLAAEAMAKLQRLKDARPAATTTASGEPLTTALVDLHHADFEHAQDLLRHLTSRNISWAMMASQGTPSEALSAFEASLSKVSLYIVVFGGVAREWVNHRLAAAMQRRAATDSLTRCIGVYLAPPAKPADATGFGSVFDVADNMAGFDPAPVDALIARAAR
jgi:CHAT domain